MRLPAKPRVAVAMVRPTMNSFSEVRMGGPCDVFSVAVLAQMSMLIVNGPPVIVDHDQPCFSNGLL